MTLPDDLENRLRRSALGAFPELGSQAPVVIQRIHERPRSTLIRCSVGAAPGAIRLVVKIPQVFARPSSDRPRIVPDTPPLEKAGFEAATLAAIDADLRRAPDPRFAAVSVIDVYEDIGAIVMTEASGAPLSGLVLRAVGRRTSGSATARLATALASAGAWLHRFQRLDLATQRTARFESRAEVVAMARDIAAYLAPRTTRPAAVRDVVERFSAAADDLLPEKIPTGLHHGDFAIRNLLISPEGIVTTIDALGRWRMPVYDDLARMIVAIETSRIQSSSFGLALRPAQLTTMGDAILAGYGADEVDPAAVRVYAVLVLLDRWAARSERRVGRGGRLASMSRTLSDRRYALVARRLLAPRIGRGA